MKQEFSEISAIGRSLSEANTSRIGQIHKISGEMLSEAGAIPFAEVIPMAASAHTDSPSRLREAVWNQSLNAAVQWLDSALLECAFSKGGNGEAVSKVLSAFSSEVKNLFEACPFKPPQGAVPISLEREPDGRVAIECSMAIECPVDELEEIEVAAGANHHPVRGVLFRVDEPSESAPSIGTGKPLFIPRAVAERIVGHVKNLPLDADDSLGKHANDKIVGVMVKAEIVGNDFIVEGHLWPWNNRAKVRLISANNGQLGMSMNAYAKGRNEVINGVETFWIEELDLLGANILFRDRATFRKTHFAAEAKANEQEQVMIAAGAISTEVLDVENESDGVVETEASSSSPYSSDSTQQNEMDNQIILLQLETISRMLTETVSSLGEEVSELRLEVREGEDRIEKLLSKERAEMEQIEASRRQTEAEQQKQHTVQEIVAAVTAAINPSGQPRRITTPIAAGGATAAAQGSFPKEVVELLCERTRIDTQIQSTGMDLQQELALTDRKRDLNTQLANLGYAS